MKKERKDISKKKIIILVIILIIIVFLAVFGAGFYLYIKVLLGNDLIIKINADKENLFLAHGQSDIVKINAYAITNIFCDTNCVSEFTDLSSGGIIEKDAFNLKLPRTIEYNLTVNKLGEGQDLYKFDIECKSKKTYLCATKGELKKRSVLITLDYSLNEEDKALKQELRGQINPLISRLNYILLNLDNFEKAIEKLNKTLETNFLRDDFNKVKLSFLDANETFEKIINLWESEDYLSLEKEMSRLSQSFSELETEFNKLNSTLFSNVLSYNSLIENITEIKNKLEAFQKNNHSIASALELKKLIQEFNNLVKSMEEKDKLSDKEDLAYKLLNKTESLSTLIKEEIEKNLTLDHQTNGVISSLNLTEIKLNEINLSLFELKEPPKKCCLYGKCEPCCDETCFNNPEKYPIILLHGHSFNEQASAESSLDGFEDTQRILENDGYLNAGSILLSSSKENLKGVLGKTTSQITIKSSYYFDILTNQGKQVLIQTKTDNLDTYTLRLRDIINAVKFKTNQDKVIILTYSMGGLIVRRYMQVFGENDIGKLIMISVPNKGISGNVLKYCTLFGTELECRDMGEDSLFMNKLNNAKNPGIPIYNIIGIGCDTEGETGDGIVKNSSAYLPYAENYFVEGICKESEFEYLHVEIMDFNKYPEVYEIIKNSLKNNSTSLEQDYAI